MIRIRRSTPVMIVETIEPVLAFWCDRLGFARTIEVPDGERLAFLAVERDGVELMFQTWSSVQADAGASVHPRQPHDHTPLFLEVEALAPIQAALRGAEVLVAERTTPYGSRETIVRAPNGQVVVFAEMPPR
ncbi:MAG: hypothetical protein JNM84_13745 [Planctomycetes bacterium]|nr:hypothetical protein [Planctomycetota bacterium]